MLRERVAAASLVTAQPCAAALHVAAVCETPATPNVAPVVRAAHPAPAHCAAAWDVAYVAGAFLTGFFASAAACLAAAVAFFAAAAAAVAALRCVAVAPVWAATPAACLAFCSASFACAASWAALVLLFSAVMSATTWPAPAVELVWTT